MSDSKRQKTMGRVEGKRILVTAAGQGIGKASAIKLAEEGAAIVYATDIREDLLKDLKQYKNIVVRKLDVTNKDEIDAIAKEVGTLDVLFNCAGFVHNGNILAATEEDFDFAVNLNIKSLFRMIKAFVPGMLEQEKGSIVNVASVAGSIKGAPNRLIYGMSKAAVIGLTKAVAADHVAQNVRCNAICPGTIETPSLGDRINANADPVAAKKAFIARQPMGRLGKAEEVANLVLYLASDESAFTTGHCHVIDGGWSN
mmetsp:Transcript_35649/g.42947  ORF Transcript_35649/g.42947 Transcript_35649/m.42947 type:complete len:256 (-) Transcript_35649:495-1262(-)|eukprot:CAMPEP_0197854486 /NCGR_PEP_ID=MMETSP1438-20131217/24781_1 /TAXON_ID=1461541 /ORGANISM="Pterosperma sp., Strain CCMP1384" /LENGTH=255 /DNA_ID=CAMNT_0043469247 /DNA_START=82 /DNA_END=849 /DNA_ORIENTATION=+